MVLIKERRGYTRFSMSHTGSSLSLLRDPGPEFSLESCELLNISFAGMGCKVNSPLAEGTVYPFLIVLKGDLEGRVLVRARVRWVESCGPSAWPSAPPSLHRATGGLDPDTGEVTDAMMWFSEDVGIAVWRGIGVIILLAFLLISLASFFPT